MASRGGYLIVGRAHFLLMRYAPDEVLVRGSDEPLRGPQLRCVDSPVRCGRGSTATGRLAIRNPFLSS